MSEKPKTGARAPEARRRITLERVYQADVQDVWDLWTTKDGIESWWGPGGRADSGSEGGRSIVSKRTEPYGLGRSVGAVVAGLWRRPCSPPAPMHATGVFPPWGQPMSDGLFVWATVYRAAFTVLG
jgi:hypothetical protein